MKRYSLFVALALVVGLLSPPAPASHEVKERNKVSLRKARDYAERYWDQEFFDFLPEPKRGEWLYRFRERGQMFEEYLLSQPTRPTKQRTKIVLQPLGQFTDEQFGVVKKVGEFARAYFCCRVEIAVRVPLPVDNFRARRSGKRTWRQYVTGHLLDEVLQPRLPEDAICYLGVTMADLYAGEGWNYVFGESSLANRVAVYSLARYFPEFWGLEDSREEQQLALVRSCKVLSHETCHAFSMPHCIHFRCNVNGSNNLPETDRQPIHLCPVCLKKLQWNLGFDVIERYESLLKFYNREALLDEAKWVERRIKKLKAEPRKAQSR